MMQSTVLRVVLIVLACLVLLLCAGNEALQWMDSFSGEICVPLNREERMVVRLAADTPLPAWLAKRPDLRSVSAEEIPFQEPATARGLPGDTQRYDAMTLPYSIRLKRVSVLLGFEPSDALTITAPESNRTVDIAANGQVDINGEACRVEVIRKWSGLLRHPSGEALAMISIRRDAETWTDDIVLAKDMWRRIELGIGVRLSWSSSEAAAREALAKGLPGIESARWGAVDGAAVNWFESFTPGTGADLSGGGSVTLRQLDEHRDGQPAIEVEIAKPGDTKTIWVPANEANANAPIRFEYFARMETVIFLNAFGEGQVVAGAFYRQQACGTAVLAAGETWMPKPAPYEVRLDQALENAVVVTPKESTLYEAVLRTPSRTLRLRQGEAVREGDSLVEFTRKAPPPRVCFDLATVKGDSKQERAFSLGPDATVRVGDWRFSQAAGSDPLRAAVLHAEFAPARPWSRIVMAGALAALVWLVMLARPAHRDAEPH